MKLYLLTHDIGLREKCAESLPDNAFQLIPCEKLADIKTQLQSIKKAMLLMDLQSPDAGFEKVAWLRKHHSQIQIILLSRYITQQLEIDAFHSGALDIWSKDIPADVLAKKIQHHAQFKAQPDKNLRPFHQLGKILTVDDEAEIRNFLDSFLEDKGYAVESVHSGEEALKSIREKETALVLLDIKLPGMNGIATLKAIKSMKPKIPVIMITGMKDQKYAYQSAMLGAYEYILKPFDLNYLESVLMTRLHLAA